MREERWHSVFTAAPSEAFGSVWTPMDVDPENQHPERRYTLGPELGRGGMGVVWLARDEWLHRDVALKRPHNRAADPRLVNEASLTARLQHPGIATLLDVGKDEQGVFYTMPVLVGCTFSDWLKRDGVTLPAAVRLLVRTCEAIGFAHSTGVVHRDVKPENLFVGEHGQVWVLDWGVAVLEGAVATGFVGTRNYAAPEQADVPADPSFDVYSLGRVLSDVLAVFGGGPPELRTLVGWCCAPSAERLDGAVTLGQQLEAWLDGQPVRGHAYSPGRVLRLWLARHWRPVAVAVAFGTGLAMVGMLGMQARWLESERAELAVSQTLAIQAEVLRVDGRQPGAEVLAAKALGHWENPIARGVLAASRKRAMLLGRTPLPCADPHVSNTNTLWCGDWRSASEYDVLGRTLRTVVPGTPTAGPLRFEDDRVLRDLVPFEGGVLARDMEHVIEFWTDGNEAEVVATWPIRLFLETQSPGLVRGPNALGRIDRREVAWMESVCTQRIEGATRLGERFAAACYDRTLRIGEWGEPFQPIELTGRRPHRVLFVGTHLVVSTWEGELGVLTDGRWTWRDTSVGALRQLADLGEGRLGLVGEKGEARVFDLGRVDDGVSLPGNTTHLMRVGDQVVQVGDDLALWRVAPTEPLLWDHRHAGGVSYLDLSPDGRHLMAGHGTGEITVFDTITGSMRQLAPPGTRVAKGGCFLTDDRLFGFFEDQRGEFDVDTGTFTPWDGSWVQRAIPFGPGILAYGWGGLGLELPTGRVERTDLDFSDAMVREDKAYLLHEQGDLSILDSFSLDSPQRRTFFEDGGWLAVTDHTVLRASGRTLEAKSQHGKPLWSEVLRRDATALDANERFIAVGDVKGGLTILAQDGDVKMWVPTAHERRVSEVILRDDVVYSSSFDGRVRKWNLAELSQPAADVQRAVSVWGLTAETVLDPR